MELIPGFAKAEINFERTTPNFDSYDEKFAAAKRENLADIFASIQADDKEAREVAEYLFQKMDWNAYVHLLRTVLAGKRDEVFALMLEQCNEAADARAEARAEAEL